MRSALRIVSSSELICHRTREKKLAQGIRAAQISPMAVSDRDYMRDDFPRSSSARTRAPASAFKRVMILISAVFLIQYGLGFLGEQVGTRFMPWGGVSMRELGQGHVWTIVTYMFVHGSVGHFMLNMLMLWFVGRQVQDLFGSRHFLQIFLFSGIFGAALEMVVNAFVHGNTVTPLVGASASAFGLLLALAVLLPMEQITVFIYFIIPVPLRLWTLAKALCIIQLVFAVAGVLFPKWLPEGMHIAYFAHLGGAAVGWFYARALGYGGQPMTYASQWQPETTRKRQTALAQVRSRVEIDLDSPPSASPVPVAAIETEVDDILDKILLHGIGSLTEEEKRLLERASAEINQRGETMPRR
ncbi:MAG: rhomboid family intramembrane serine protease [Verrucomicrobiaceae bacterium]|nr:rhomboid family intramembrane serine protease [Verrucomicrobiaceae bacterium]